MELSFDAVVNQLRNALPNFTNAYNRFVASYALVKDDPALVAEWRGLKEKADGFVSAVRWANEQIDTVTDWFSGSVGSWLGLSGLRGLNGLHQVGGQLGIAWVPIAWLVGTVSGLIAITGAMWSFVKRAELRHAEFLERAKLVAQTGNTEILTAWDRDNADDCGFWCQAGGKAGMIIGVGLIGVAAYFLLPKLSKLAKR